MKILFISLGCDKNLVDTEVMLGLLASKGYEMTDDEQEADIIVINTCCFIHDAKEESIQNILEMAELKKEGKVKALIVTGCMAERYKDEILEEIPEVDEVLGTTAYDKILDAVDAALEGNQEVILSDIDALPLPETKRLVTTGGHFAYLKIAEGCDKHCTYCIIPKVRGNYRSVPMERLVNEARELAERGGKRADPCGTGDDAVWKGSLWKKSHCISWSKNCVISAESDGSVFYTVIRKRLQMN